MPSRGCCWVAAAFLIGFHGLPVKTARRHGQNSCREERRSSCTQPWVSTKLGYPCTNRFGKVICFLYLRLNLIPAMPRSELLFFFHQCMSCQTSSLTWAGAFNSSYDVGMHNGSVTGAFEWNTYGYFVGCNNLGLPVCFAGRQAGKRKGRTVSLNPKPLNLKQKETYQEKHVKQRTRLFGKWGRS